MVNKAQIIRWARPAKYATRKRNFCFRCGRTRGYVGDFNVCRICLREMAHRGEIPGMRKASW